MKAGGARTRELAVGGLLNALFIIPILAILIFLHELGHFVMARRAGVRVEEFGFGLPPRIWGVKRGDTIYSINALPIGGFVRVLGEDGKSSATDSMQSKTAGQRASFLAAGSIMNFLTAFVIVAILVVFQGRPEENVYVVEVMEDTPAAEAGWQAGDQFVRIAGEDVERMNDILDLTVEHAGEPMEVVVERNGQLIETTVVPREDPPDNEGRTGIRMSAFRVAHIEVTEVPDGSAAAAAGLREGDIITAVDGEPVTDFFTYWHAVQQNEGESVTLTVQRDGETMTLPVQVPAEVPELGEPLGEKVTQDVRFERVPVTQMPAETLRVFFDSIARMGEGLVSLIRGETPFGDIAGPIGMGQLTAEVIEQSSLPLWVTLANLTFILSLNLGLLNLLPLPALDGGRLLFVAVEIARRGKRVAPEKEGVVHFVGLVLLLTAMFVIAFLDIDRIISGNSFLD